VIDGTEGVDLKLTEQPGSAGIASQTAELGTLKVVLLLSIKQD
jgi:hypothetical protein